VQFIVPNFSFVVGALENNLLFCISQIPKSRKIVVIVVVILFFVIVHIHILMKSSYRPQSMKRGKGIPNIYEIMLNY